MAKYLMLSPDPAQRWVLPADTDTEALKERLRTAVVADQAGVEVIPVMLGAKQTNLYVAKRRLNTFAVVETPDVRPSVRYSEPDDFRLESL